MCGRTHRLLCLLAAGSALLLIAALFLPTFAAAFFVPPAGLIVGVGSLWGASKALAAAVAIVLLCPILAPCFTPHGGRWLLPLTVTILATLALAFMIVANLAATGRFGFTIFGLAALTLLGLCTLAETIVARRLAKAAASSAP